jgi:excisionase family DNA binding protein
LTFIIYVANNVAVEITTAEAAKRLGVTQQRIRQLISDGTIKARHLTGRMLLIDEQELEKPVALNRGKPGRQPKDKK